MTASQPVGESGGGVGLVTWGLREEVRRWWLGGGVGFGWGGGSRLPLVSLVWRCGCMVDVNVVALWECRRWPVGGFGEVVVVFQKFVDASSSEMLRGTILEGDIQKSPLSPGYWLVDLLTN